MTFETMEAAVAQLKAREVPASFEHPGFICVFIEGGSLNFGTSGADWLVGDESKDDGTFVAAYDSNIDADSSDAQAIAQFIETTYRQRIAQ